MQGRAQGSSDSAVRLRHQLGDLAQENEQLRGTLLQAQGSVRRLQSELQQLRRKLPDQGGLQQREQLRETAEEELPFPSCARMLRVSAWSLYESKNQLPHEWGQVGARSSPGLPRLPWKHRGASLPSASRALQPLPLAQQHSPPQGTSSRHPGAPPRSQQSSASSTDMDTDTDTDMASSRSDATSGSLEDAPATSARGDTEPPCGDTEPRGRLPGRTKLPAFTPQAAEAAGEPTAPGPILRLVLAGESGAGKSSFLLRLCSNEFSSDAPSTLGVDFCVKQLLVDGEPTTLQIWDTAGQERFRSIARSYFRKAHGVLLLYDVSDQGSFLGARQWIEDIKAAEGPLPLMLVGNKMDLRAGLPAGVGSALGEKLAMAHSVLFCETSAKDGINVVEAVLHLAREVKRRTERGRAGSVLQLGVPARAARGCCRT